MNRNPGPLSPASSASNDSYGPRYANMPSSGPPGQGAFMGAPSDVPYSGGPYGAARPLHTSPPSSSHQSSATDASRPSASSAGRPPSSTSSVGGRSDGRGMGMHPANGHRDSTRSVFRPEHEDVLQKHYYSLQTYLAAHLRDEKGNMKPNRARDKLLRLSVTQFMELSTDVYDELIRREDDRSQRVPNVPRFLPPKQNFHPKRNQARQKLSTLPVERFRQLATDVFFELERRVPRFGAGDIDRPMSGGPRAPSRGGMRPPPGWRGPPPPNGAGRPYPNGWNGNPMYPGSRSHSPAPNGYPGPRSRQPSDASSLGRPLPKAFGAGTVVPNKSTMVEDDDDADDIDGLSGRFSEMERDKETIRSQESEIERLKEQLESLESQLGDKSAELETAQTSDAERNEWYGLREDLEQKLADAERLNDQMRQELDMVKRSKHMDEQNLRDQLDGTSRDLEDMRAHHEDLQQQLSDYHASGRQGAGSEEQQHKIHMLEEDLAKQERLTNEVREESMQNLQEMRELSRQNDRAIEQEERLAAQVTALERDVNEWRQRYAKVKSQNKSLRASTMGLGLQTAFDAGSLMRKEGLISTDGLVKDVDVTRFQLAVDELLKTARQTDTNAMIESVKQVTISVKSITANIGTDGYPTPSPSPHSPDSPPDVSVAKLKARVTGTANSLITATKQHATASGLSPVALLDAAASNLTASIVELVKAVGIRPSSENELQDADLDSFYGDRGSEEYDGHSVPSLKTAVEVRPGANGLGRSNTAKKAAGWFNWGRGTSDEISEPEHLTNGHSVADDYDPYD